MPVRYSSTAVFLWKFKQTMVNKRWGLISRQSGWWFANLKKQTWWWSGINRSRWKLNKAEVADVKKRLLCYCCHKYGHRSSDHKLDGKIKYGISSSRHSVVGQSQSPSDRASSSNSSGHSNKEANLGFTSSLIMANCKTLHWGISSNLESSFDAGPLVNEASP